MRWVLGKQPACGSSLLHCPLLAEAPWGSRGGLQQRQEAVKMIIKRSVEKDHQPVGWILTVLKCISPGVGLRMAADGGWSYL